jgi:Protein of unknown function (DUF1552)
VKLSLVSRRTALRAAGISIALPTLDAMIDGRGRWLGIAKAATQPPVRVMAFHFPHGVPHSIWTPATTGKGYAMTPGLMPLAAFQNDFNVISGLEQTAWNKGPGGGHANGFPDFATAVVTTGAGAGGPSFDQVLAAELGTATKFRSLVANREPVSNQNEGASTAHMNNIAWTGPGVFAPAERDVMNLFMTLVSAVPMASPGTVQTGPTPEALAAVAHKKSILDYVMGEVGALSTRVGAVDRARLDEHLTALREVERVLTAAPLPTIAGCSRPVAPTSAEAMSYDLRSKVFLRLIAMAFRCDLTRYASFALSNGFDDRSYAELSTLNNYHQITHTGGHYGPDPPNVELKFVAYFAGLLAYFLNELKMTGEGAGTLLDNCLIYYGSEMAEGWHTNINMPVVLCGKAGGQVVTGRHLQYPDPTPLAKLFLAILQFGGSKTKTFGLGGDAPLDGLTT